MTVRQLINVCRNLEEVRLITSCCVIIVKLHTMGSWSKIKPFYDFEIEYFSVFDTNKIYISTKY